MGKTAILTARIVGDADNAVKSFKETENAAERFGGAVDRVASAAAFGIITSKLKDLATASMTAAADAEQNIGAVATVFGSAADTIVASSKEAADAVGMSASSYNELAAGIGGSMRSAVSSQEELAAKTQELISAGADLSSVFGGSAADAVSAMGAALRGEFDPLEQFGVFLNMDAVKAELAAKGLDKLSGAAGDAAKKTAIQSLIMQQASAYTGNFANESDTAAGAQQRAKAAWEDAQASLGAALLPAIVAVSRGMAAFSKFAQANAAWLTPLILIFGGLAAGILLYNGIMAAVPAVTAAWTAAQWLLNAALSANPIGIVVIAIGALVAALVWAWNTSEQFRATVTAAFEWVVASGQRMGAWFMALPVKIASWLGNTGKILWNAGRAIIDGFLGGLRAAWDGVTSFISGIGPWIAAHKGPISYDRTLLQPAGRAIMGGLNASLRAGMADTRSIVGDVNGLVGGIGGRAGTATVSTAGVGSSGGSTMVVNITVQGAVDPYGTAQQIKDLLDDLERSQGGAVGVRGGGSF